MSDKSLKSIFENYVKEDKSGKPINNQDFLNRLKSASMSGFGSLSGGLKGKLGNLKNLTGNMGNIKGLAGSFGNINSLTGKLEDLNSLDGKFKDLMGKFPNLGTDNLKKMFGDIANNFLNNAENALRNMAKSSIKYLQDAAVGFAENLANGTTDALLSRINLPEETFLLTLKSLVMANGNLNYKDDYIRKMAIKRDLALVLEYIDKENNKNTYSYENSNDILDMSKAAKNGAYRVAVYIIRFFNKDRIEIKNAIKETQKDYKKAINLLKTKSEAKEEIPLELKDKIKNLETTINRLKAENIKCSRIINRGIKQILVYSYSTLEKYEFIEILDEFNVNPSIFGENDNEYAGEFKIRSADINKMVPFFKPKNNKSANNKNTSATKSFDAKMRKNKLIGSKDYETKFISPRNRSIKHIYLYLASTTKHGTNYMYSPELYERLRCPNYSSILEAADNAAADFFNIGIGKAVFDVTEYIGEKMDTMCYDYTKKVEKLLYSPQNVKYMTANTKGSLPEPSKPVKRLDESKPNSNEPYYDPKLGKWVYPNGEYDTELPEGVSPVYEPHTGRWVNPITGKFLKGEWNYPRYKMPVYNNKTKLYIDPTTGEPIKGEWNTEKNTNPPFYDNNKHQWIDPFSKQAIILAQKFNNSWYIPKYWPILGKFGTWYDPLTLKPLEGKWNNAKKEYSPYLDHALGKWCDPQTKKPIAGDWNVPQEKPEPVLLNKKWCDSVLKIPFEGDWNTEDNPPYYNITRGIWCSPDGRALSMIGNIEVIKPIYSLKLAKWINPQTQQVLKKQPRPPMNGKLPHLRLDPSTEKYYWYQPNSNVIPIDGTWNDGTGDLVPVFDKNNGIWCHPVGNFDKIEESWNEPFSYRSYTNFKHDVWVLGYDTIFDIDDEYWDQYKREHPDHMGSDNPDDPRSFLDQLDSLTKRKNKFRRTRPEDYNNHIDRKYFSPQDINIEDYSEKFKSDFGEDFILTEYLAIDFNQFGIPKPPRRGYPIWSGKYWCDSYLIESMKHLTDTVNYPGLDASMFEFKTVDQIMKMIKDDINNNDNSVYDFVKLRKGNRPINITENDWDNNLKSWVTIKDGVYQDADGIWCHCYGERITYLTNNEDKFLYSLPRIDVEKGNMVYTDKEGNIIPIEYYDTSLPFDLNNGNNDKEKWTKIENIDPHKKYSGFKF